MIEATEDFSRRLKRLTKKHRAMGNGYTTRLRADGLIVVEPKRMRPPRPYSAIVMILGGLFLLKGLMLAANGPATYSERLSSLEAGTVFQQAGAWIMQIDPVTELFARVLAPVV